MNTEPRFLSDYALTRILTSMATRMGMDPTMAGAISQIHVAQSKVSEMWSDFLTQNCSTCKHSPGSCALMQPPEDSCIAGSTPSTVRDAYAAVIESGSLQMCPVRECANDT